MVLTSLDPSHLLAPGDSDFGVEWVQLLRDHEYVEMLLKSIPWLANNQDLRQKSLARYSLSMAGSNLCASHHLYDLLSKVPEKPATTIELLVNPQSCVRNVVDSIKNFVFSQLEGRVLAIRDLLTHTVLRQTVHLHKAKNL